MFDIVESMPSPKWRRKRKRSCPSEGGPRERMPQVKAKKEECATASASLNTPLNFPRSESYGKLKRSSKKSFKKKSMRECIALVDELTQRGYLLRKGINKVTEYRNKLKAENSQLKAIKQELLNASPMRKEEEQIAKMLVSDQTAEECQYSLGLCTAQLNASN